MAPRYPLKLMAAACAAGLVLAACSSGTPSSSTAATGTPKRGGTFTYIDVTAQWPTLDPATSTTALSLLPEFNIIYGQLFQYGKDNVVQPDLASAYTWSADHKELDITIRPNLTFSNGDPFTAENAAWSINRDLSTATCICRGAFSDVSSVSWHDDTVVMKLKYADAAFMYNFWSNAPNWIEDKTAFDSMGLAAYGAKPIGAGPFTVKTNQLNTQLDLVRNTKFWEPGKPYLDEIKYIAVQDEPAAVAALASAQAGGAAVLSPVTAHDAQVAGQYNVVHGPHYSYYFLDFNQKSAPMNNLTARQALLYATSPSQISNSLFFGLLPQTEGPTASSQQYYYGQTVAGYPEYNVAKAKALVSQLGGLSVSLMTTATNGSSLQMAEALQKQWEAAGINVTLDPEQIIGAHAKLAKGQFNVLLDQYGSLDPSPSLKTWFASTGPYSTTADPALDTLIQQGSQSFDDTQRAAIYKQIGEQMATNADAGFLYQGGAFYITSKSVGWISQNYPSWGQIFWEDVYMN